MSLVHIVVTKVTGYDLFTLYFDDREEKDIEQKSSFSAFEEEFIQPAFQEQVHPEYRYSLSYYGYFSFPGIRADEVHELYKNRCESKPNLKKRYNIYFDKEHVHLEEMIRKFDRPVDAHLNAEHKFKTYCHRIEYFERSVQILRDMQTAIYETNTEIASKELKLHKRYLKSLSGLRSNDKQ
jgi:hypothetical protein